MMTRLLVSALLVLAPALPASAQVRAATVGNPSLLSAPAAVAPFVPSLSASPAALASAGASLSAPIPALPATLPALPLSAVNAAPILAAPERAASADKARPTVLRSLRDLRFLSQTQDGLRAGAVYDGALDSGKPEVLPGMPGVAVKSARGGLSEFQPHEVATIRKIQVWASDLKVLVREAGATPDLVVNGVVTELKTAHKGKIAPQLVHANGQLLAHARRHGLGLGAVAVDVLGRPMTTEQIEEEIAQVVRESPAIGFARVYVFHGGEVKTYAPAADGSFRLDPSALPFAPLATDAVMVPAPDTSFVPAMMSRAVLPDLDVMKRELLLPSRILHAHGIKATVTIYGSARILPPETAQANLDAALAQEGRRPKDKAAKASLAQAREAARESKYYQIAREVGALVARGGGGKIAVVTGGGPGIMEAANRGAFEAGGLSVGFNIKLPNEQSPNPYTTPELSFAFENFPTRKIALRYGSMGRIFMPGGFGTMDELFEVVTQIQEGKLPKVPIVLVGREYWNRVLNFEEFARRGLISRGDLSLFTYAETAQEAWDAIRAPYVAAASKR